MEFKRSNVRTWSMLGPRGAFGMALADAAQHNERIVALTADLCTTSGLDRFRSAFPHRLFNVGIAEQNMVGIAAGLAAGGNIPYATTFANFAALRSCEQIRHYMGYMKENVKLVGFGAGFAMGMFGTAHYGTEDMAAIRAINNIVILSPADSGETVKATSAAACFDGPIYLRLAGVMNNPVVYKEDYDFEIGKAITLREGTDIAIIATGTMVHSSLKAAMVLEERGLSCKVIDMHTIKPLDENVFRVACETRLIVTVEEHSIIGGLGGAVAECLAQSDKHPPLLIIGISDEYKHAGDYSYLLEQYGLTPEKIAENISQRYMELSSVVSPDLARAAHLSNTEHSRRP